MGMVKRIAVALVAAMVVAGAAGAQEKFLINAGIGYGFLPYKMSLPPISASVEYMLDSIPLSIGGYFGMTGYKEDATKLVSYKASMVGFGAKGSWHFGFGPEKLDPYAGLVLGWLVYNQEVTTTVPEVKAGGIVITKETTTTAKNNLSTFLYGINVGARYFFTNNIGAYLELGYSAVSVASVGLAVKF